LIFYYPNEIKKLIIKAEAPQLRECRSKHAYL